MSILAISAANAPYLDHAKDWLISHFAEASTVLLVPDAVPKKYRIAALTEELESCGVKDAAYMAERNLASVLSDKDLSADIMGSAREAYAKANEQFFSSIGINVVSSHRLDNPAGDLTQGKFDGVCLMGGSVVDLEQALEENGLLTAIKDEALKGMPVAGVSAGAHILTPQATATTTEQPYDGSPLPTLRGMGLAQAQFIVHADPDNPETKMEFAHAYFDNGGNLPVIMIPEKGALKIPVTEAEKTSSQGWAEILGDNRVNYILPKDEATPAVHAAKPLPGSRLSLRVQ